MIILRAMNLWILSWNKFELVLFNFVISLFAFKSNVWERVFLLLWGALQNVVEFNKKQRLSIKLIRFKLPVTIILIYTRAFLLNKRYVRFVSYLIRVINYFCIFLLWLALLPWNRLALEQHLYLLFYV